MDAKVYAIGSPLEVLVWLDVYAKEITYGSPSYRKMGNFHDQHIFTVFAVVVGPQNLIYTSSF